MKYEFLILAILLAIKPLYATAETRQFLCQTQRHTLKVEMKQACDSPDKPILARVTIIEKHQAKNGKKYYIPVTSKITKVVCDNWSKGFTITELKTFKLYEELTQNPLPTLIQGWDEEQLVRFAISKQKFSFAYKSSALDGDYFFIKTNKTRIDDNQPNCKWRFWHAN